MEKFIQVTSKYQSLDTLQEFLKQSSQHECTKNYDKWELRTDVNNQMAKCLVVKKSSMHAIKVFFAEENVIKVNHIIPNSVMNAYFGKSVKARKNILEIVTGKVKELILIGSQKKAFEELVKPFEKISAQ